jgi:NitT/TauT family transport system substrate-binding protein
MASVFLVAACGGGDDTESSGDNGAELTTIELAAIPPGSLLPAWPLLVADNQGFFEENGVKVNFNFTFDGGQLLAGDQVDILSDAADSGLIAASQGKDIVMVAPLLLQVTDGLLVSPDVESVADLEGQVVRSSGFGTDEYVARQFIESEGLSADDVEWIGIEDEAAALAQLQSGKIQGGMFGLGPILDAERSGDFNVLGKLGDLGTYPWNILQTTQSYADENPDALRGFLAGVREGVEFMTNPDNQETAVEVAVATGVGLEEKFVNAAYEVAVDEQIYATGDLAVEDIQPGLDFLEFAGEEVDEIDLESLINNDFNE